MAGLSVYKITHAKTGRAYFGIARNPRARWGEHVRSALNGSNKTGRLSRAIRKYGRDAFVFEIIYEAVDLLEACMVERGLIAQHGTLGPSGFNSSSGGEFAPGVTRGLETRAKLSHLLKRQWQDPKFREATLARIRNWDPPEHHKDHLRRQAAAMKGRKRSPQSIEKGRLKRLGHEVSEETREKLRKANLGKVMSPEAKARLSAVFKERPLTEANRMAISEGQKRRWSQPGYKESRSGHKRPGHGEKMRALWAENRARMMGVRKAAEA